MNAFAVVNQGIESMSALEIKELVPAANIRGSDGIIAFDVHDFRDFCKLAYCSQSLSRVCFLICEFEAAASLAAAAKNLKQRISGFKLADWITDGDSFVVECDRNGTHDFNSLDFATEANKVISEISGNDNVSFKSPILRFFCCINHEKGYFGVDVAGFDLGKREYRLFGHASDLKATVAYSLVRLSGFSLGKRLLDPFCRSGAIAIEAALFTSRLPVNYYRRDSFSFLKLKPFSRVDCQKLFASIDGRIRRERQPIFNFSPSITHVVSSEKNAKLAGVNKSIDFSRVDLEWLELKFEKGTVDFMVSFPPMLSRSANDSKIKKIYVEFFYQASLILQKDGRIVLAARDAEALEWAARNQGFRLDSRLEFSMGPEKRVALVFARA